MNKLTNVEIIDRIMDMCNGGTIEMTDKQMMYLKESKELVSATQSIYQASDVDKDVNTYGILISHGMSLYLMNTEHNEEILGVINAILVDAIVTTDDKTVATNRVLAGMRDISKDVSPDMAELLVSKLFKSTHGTILTFDTMSDGTIDPRIIQK